MMCEIIFFININKMLFMLVLLYRENFNFSEIFLMAPPVIRPEFFCNFPQLYFSKTYSTKFRAH